jgi:hypothetical protein
LEVLFKVVLAVRAGAVEIGVDIGVRIEEEVAKLQDKGRPEIWETYSPIKFFIVR